MAGVKGCEPSNQGMHASSVEIGLIWLDGKEWMSM